MYEFQFLNEQNEWVTWHESRNIDARGAAEEWAYFAFQIGLTPGTWDWYHQRILGPDPEPETWPPHNVGFGPRPTDVCHPAYVCKTPADVPWWRKKGGVMKMWESRFDLPSITKTL
jgi:hypothetical protein